MDVQITIKKECTSLVANTLNFGTRGVLGANIDVATTLSFTCTKDAPFTITMDAGDGPGATVTNRKMFSGATAIQYALYRDAARTLNWGSAPVDGLAAAGTGASQSVSVYGRVPAQATPAAGTYADLVQVTLTY